MFDFSRRRVCDDATIDAIVRLFCDWRQRFGTIRKIRSSHGYLLKHVGKPFAVTHEIAARQIGAVQHLRQAFTLRPIVDDIGDAKIELARLLKHVILT